VVNSVVTEKPHYTTTRLAMAAVARGHQVFYIDADGFGLGVDDRVNARARSVPIRHFRSGEVLLREVLSDTAVRSSVIVDDFDVLMLRNNPNEDVFARPWARMAPIDFGAMVAERGVFVVNNPSVLARSLTKLYLRGFPRSVRPDTLVTRDRDQAREFIADHEGYAVFKPLFGYGGHNVFLVRPEARPNVNQMFESVADEGFVIVQEYLPEAVQGDTRLFVMNGDPLVVAGHIAAVRRRRRHGEGDMRSNITAGATTEKAIVDDAMLELVDQLKPKLIEDGIFLAGVDIVGDKVMEINIMTPGALHHAEVLEGVNFATAIIDALDSKSLMAS
jgi:glutathione synthase